MADQTLISTLMHIADMLRMQLLLARRTISTSCKHDKLWTVTMFR